MTSLSHSLPLPLLLLLSNSFLTFGVPHHVFLHVSLSSLQEKISVLSHTSSHCFKVHEIGNMIGILCEQSTVQEVKMLLIKKSIRYFVGTISHRLSLDYIPRYDEINEYIKDIAVKYSSFVSIESRGRSQENRDIWLVKFTASETSPTMYVDGGLSGQDWMSVYRVLYVMDELVSLFSNAEMIDERRQLNWLFLPLLNPDGFEYSHTNIRSWKKNRATSPLGSNCNGVNLNSNWRVNPSDPLVTSDPCSDYFGDTTPFSQPEVKAALSVALEYNETIETYIGLRSFGTIIISTIGKRSWEMVEEISLGIYSETERNYDVGLIVLNKNLPEKSLNEASRQNRNITISMSIEPEFSYPSEDSLTSSELQSLGRDSWIALHVLSKRIVNLDSAN